MRVLVCGDRNWTDYERIYLRLWELSHPVTVVQGAAKGADTLAGKAAIALGYNVEVFPANWAAFGRAAGPIRNQEMLDTHPDLVLYAHDDLDNSKGTANCVREAEKRGIPVERIP